MFHVILYGIIKQWALKFGLISKLGIAEYISRNGPDLDLLIMFQTSSVFEICNVQVKDKNIFIFTL